MDQKTEPSGLGGWLILPMLGLIFTPFSLGIMLVTSFYPIFSEGHWWNLTTPESDAYHPLWAPLLVFEIAGNSIFFISSIILLVLFFKKHHRFPKLMIWYLGLNLAFIVIDLFAANLIPAVAAQSNSNEIGELIRSLIGTAIWIPYFLKSVRVKNTFINGMIEQGNTDNRDGTVSNPWPWTR